MKIGIISDTHGVFCEDWCAQLAGCEYLIHAGDINTKTCYDRLKKLDIPLYMVRGNCDKGSWAAYLPEFLQVSIGGKIFYIVHNQNDLPFDLTDADFLIFGHTHRYTYYERYGKIFLNPGSAGEGRGASTSMAILDFHGDTCDIKRILL